VLSGVHNIVGVTQGNGNGQYQTFIEGKFEFSTIKDILFPNTFVQVKTIPSVNTHVV
jgi:hypothetical protein